MLVVPAVFGRWKWHAAEIDFLVDFYQYGIVAGTGSMCKVEKLAGNTAISKCKPKSWSWG